METSAAQAFFPNKTLTYSQKLNWASQAKFKSKIYGSNLSITQGACSFVSNMFKTFL